MNIKFLICVFAVLLASASASILDMDRAETIEGLARRGLLSGSGGGYVNTDSVSISLSVACAAQTSCELSYELETAFSSNKVYWYASACAVGSSPSCVEIAAADIVDGSGAEAFGVCTSSPCTMDGLDANTDYFFYTVSSDGTKSYPDDAGEYSGEGTTWNVAPEVIEMILTDTPATGHYVAFDVTVDLPGTVHYYNQRYCCDPEYPGFECRGRDKVCGVSHWNINWGFMVPVNQWIQKVNVTAGFNSAVSDTAKELREELRYQFCHYACDANLQCGTRKCVPYGVLLAPTVTSAAVVPTGDGAVISATVADTALYEDVVVSVAISGDASGSFLSDADATITGLAEGTEYTISLVATNDVGDSVAFPVTFTTLDLTAPVATVTVGEITLTTATLSVSADEECSVFYVIATPDLDVPIDDIYDGAVFDTIGNSGTGFVADLAIETDYTAHILVCDVSGNCGEVTKVDFATAGVPLNEVIYNGGDSQDVDGAYLIVFDVPVVASTIEAAELALPVTSGTDGSTFSVYRVNTAWNPSTADAECAAYLDGECATDAEWDILNQDGSANSASATGTYDVASGWVVFDVTSDVQNFAAGQDNYGWVVVTDSGETTFVAAGSVGVSPELRIFYPSGDVTDNGIGPICEHQTVSLSCSAGTVISLTSLTYGRNNDQICPYSGGSWAMTNTNCAAANSLATASELCNGKNSCSFQAKNNVFGDPCYGTFKYVWGRYVCVAENDIDNFCAQVDCNNGNCINSVNGAVCSCNEGWQGENCDEEVIPAPDGDLVLHWDFNDESAVDMSGNGNDGNFKTVYAASGVDGQGVAVGAEENKGYVKAADSETLRLDGDFTIAMWASPSTAWQRNHAEEPDPDTEEVQTVNEWQTMYLSCPSESQKLRITYAKYGRDSWCAASRSLEIVSEECNGRKTCQVAARNDVFGDPCYGTFKNLIVAYKCRTPIISGVLAHGGTADRTMNSFKMFHTEDGKYGSGVHTSAVIERANGRQVIRVKDEMKNDEWNFVALSFKADGEQVLYVNGEAVSQEKNLGAPVVGTDGFWVGNNNEGPLRQFNGFFDEVKVWNYALSPAEIAEERAPFVGIGGPVLIPNPNPDDDDTSTNPETGVGCADGTREGFVGEPDIAACAGGWDVPGFVSDASKTPKCARKAGNDGASLSGCSAADICAAGFHVCETAEEVRAKTASKAGCDDVSAWDNGFYATRQSGNGNRNCASHGQNDVFGCGSEGDPVIRNCGGLNRFSHNHCNRLQNGWACGTHDNRGLTETDTVTHSSNTGGVLCCRDDKKTNSIPKKADNAERVIIYSDHAPSAEEIEEMRAAVAHFAVCGGKGSKSGKSKKSRCGYTQNHSTGGHTKKTGGTRRSKADVSVKGVIKSSSGKSGTSKFKSSANGRKLLQESSRTVIVFDIKGTADITAAAAAASIQLQAADPSSEYVFDFSSVVGADSMSTCANGDSSTSCTNKGRREQTELPEGTVGDGYAIQGSELSNSNPVVIGLISTIAVLVVLTLAGFAYRYRNQEKNNSFDGRVMEDELSSDRVEMDVVPSASHAAANNKQGEQETYWVFNRGAAESSDANVRVLV